MEDWEVPSGGDIPEGEPSHVGLNPVEFEESNVVPFLVGVVGSTAYGLDRPGSDIDRLGIYAAPTVMFHGVNPPGEKDGSIVRNNPDITLHEAGKFARLCLAGNPTVMELLWLPRYETVNALGRDLISIRKSFLSAQKVRYSYLGYVSKQFERLKKRNDGSFSADTRKNTAKHARHMMRLCHQGFWLYKTGELVVRLEDPERYHAFGEEIAGGNIELAEGLIKRYEAAFDVTTSVLPDRPDRESVEQWLLFVRNIHL